MSAQMDADAIRHAASMIDAVTIDAKTDDGKCISVMLRRHQDNITAWLNEQAEAIERAEQ